MNAAHVDPVFWQGKKIFLTGHTGFKGSWLSLWLASMGAKVTGYALAPNTAPNLFWILAIGSLIEKSHIADIRDLVTLQKAILESKPDVVIHMAAQPLVRYSYENPVETYATNVMGTVNVLECMRDIDSVRSTVVITTDKCYENHERAEGYREDEAMGGYDPYSSSKGCAELVISAYRRSYFSSTKSTNMIASARAGNVIGSGDWSQDRLIPDAIRAFESRQPLVIRNPFATRPWQHVLEPLSGYLILAQALYEQGAPMASSWNFGPLDKDNRSVEEVVKLLACGWGDEVSWVTEKSLHHHEAKLLKLDCTKARNQLHWIPKWGLELAVQKILEWQRAFQAEQNMREISLAQINQYTSLK
jgi:CDP-glucose 4,6-dehydratase